jgi:HSP20 family molecular chaperone IbpA
MIMGFADPFDALLDLQRSLEANLSSDWLQDLTTSRGPFPPINVFQQGDDILAIIELPGVSRSDLQIEAKENAIRIFGKKAVDYRRRRVMNGSDDGHETSKQLCRRRGARRTCGSGNPISQRALCSQRIW